VTNNFIVDHGIASEIIRMAAFEEGFGSCLIGSVDRPKLREALGISNRYELLVVLALGAPGERVVLETASGGNIRYWRDGHGALHVPKRALRDILVN
jgi:nitroreductase